MFFPQNDASTFAKAMVDKEVIESGGFWKIRRERSRALPSAPPIPNGPTTACFMPLRIQVTALNPLWEKHFRVPRSSHSSYMS